MVRLGILVFFLIFNDMLSAFHHWVWCWLYVCHICSLLCWCMFPLHPFVERFLSSMGIEFYKFNNDNYWAYHLIFIFQFVNVVYHYWLILDMQSFSYPSDKSLLITVYNPLNVLLNSFCQYFVEECCIYVHQWCNPVIYFVGVVSFSHFDIRVMLTSQNECWRVISSNFWYSLRRIGVNSSFNV